MRTMFYNKVNGSKVKYFSLPKFQCNATSNLNYFNNYFIFLFKTKSRIYKWEYALSMSVEIAVL